MVALVVGPAYFNYTQSVARGLQSLGHTVHTYEYSEYYNLCNYFEKKILKNGFNGLKNKYYKIWNDELLHKWEEIKPDLCIICNGQHMSSEILEVIKQKSRLVLWLFDGLLRPFQNFSLLPYYHNIFVYDPNDVIYIKEHYGLNSNYLNMGYDSSIYYPQNLFRDLDISFVGTMTQKRFDILKEVAKYAYQNDKKFIVYGDCWSHKYFWKARRFAKKYHPLQLYTPNKFITPVEVARLYNRSKICLNIHIKEHEGVNPRTFEICGTNSFQLVDNKLEIWQLFDEGNNMIAYRDADDLLNKIDFYLQNIECREKIAMQGYNLVSNTLTVSNIASQMLEMISQ